MDYAKVLDSCATLLHKEQPLPTRRRRWPDTIWQSVAGPDLKSHAISANDFDPTTTSDVVYVMVQRGRTYFENRDEISAVQSSFKKVHEVKIEGLTAVEVFVNR